MENNNEERLINIAKVLNDEKAIIQAMIFKDAEGNYHSFSFSDVPLSDLSEMYIYFAEKIINNKNEITSITFD